MTQFCFNLPNDLSFRRSKRWLVTPVIIALAWLTPLDRITQWTFDYSRDDLEGLRENSHAEPDSDVAAEESGTVVRDR